MEKLTIKGGYIPMKKDNIHEHLQEIKRGTGVKKNKKGKGSYTRKGKYNKILYLPFFYE